MSALARLRLSLALLIAGCATATEQGPMVSAEAWPEADALFHRDPRWLGADAAFSIPLGGERTLWLFGDSFVGAASRRASKMVRNSVAVQVGSDPSRAAISFHWREAEGKPASFFAEEGDRWFWPGHGIRVGRALVVFLTRMKATPRGLGFEAEGWRAAIVDDPDAPPDTWRPRLVEPVAAPAGFVVGQGLVLAGEHVQALAIREPGDHAAALVRWRAEALGAGRIDEAEWWGGPERGWQRDLGGPPALVMADAGPECSVHADARLGRLVHVKSLGFGATTIAVSFAEQMEGPWSAPRSVFRPAESDRANAFVYAAKGHPELSGADLVVTYAANTLAGFGTLLDDTSLYFPRFVRLMFRGP